MSHCGLGLSCEPINTAPQTCIHGLISEFACEKCMMEHRLYLLESRVKELERLNQECFNANPIKQIEDRFDELENRLESHRHDVEKELKPYKCPVCNGKGNVIIDGNQFLLSNPPQYPLEICRVCEGKGIVWG